MMCSIATKYEFATEPLSDCIEELKPLFEKNHAETGVYDKDFNPDYDRYIQLNEDGHFLVMVARLDMDAVGYSMFFIDRHPYQKDVVAAIQAHTFIDKAHRAISYTFLKSCDDMLKKLGVHSIWRQASVKHDISRIYERMGYQFIEKVYRKDL